MSHCLSHLSMKKPLIAANWKMNGTPAKALDSRSSYATHANIDVVVFPTLLDIPTCIDARLITGAQYASAEEEGPHTGDVCMAQVARAGCRYVLCGHSERRRDHAETNKDVEAQVIAALEHGLHPIVCVGETGDERKAGREKAVLKKQMASLPLTSELTFAYEPVWAIGTGETAKPEHAQEMHAYIRSLLPEEKRATTRILYGGSLKPANAKAIFSQPDIDGGLVGGASLDPDQFAAIVEAAQEMEKC